MYKSPKLHSNNIQKFANKIDSSDSFSVRMASGEQKFPPQKQNTQPGKEHVMDPLPQFTNPDYKPSNKLQVYLYIFTFKYCLLVQVVCTIHILKENLMSFFRFCVKFQGKIAVITGGDSGIGRAVCNLFSLEGATVVFTYVKGDEDKDAKDTLEMIKKSKSADAKDPLALAADLGFDENCKRVIDEIVSAYGHIDILVNNAAEQYECSSVEEIDEPRLERVFRTNIFSYFFMTR